MPPKSQERSKIYLLSPNDKINTLLTGIWEKHKTFVVIKNTLLSCDLGGISKQTEMLTLELYFICFIYSLWILNEIMCTICSS
jgi:hypothetical protein